MTTVRQMTQRALVVFSFEAQISFHHYYNGRVRVHLVLANAVNMAFDQCKLLFRLCVDCVSVHSTHKKYILFGQTFRATEEVNANDLRIKHRRSVSPPS